MFTASLLFLAKPRFILSRALLVYVFDKILDKREFNGISHIISHQIEIDTDEVMDDDCGTRRSQYMNGVWGNDEVYCSNLIYSVSAAGIVLTGTA